MNPPPSPTLRSAKTKNGPRQALSHPRAEIGNILAGLDHKDLLRLLFAGQFLLPGTRGKRLTGGVLLAPQLSQKKAGAVPPEDKLAALWGAARFLPDGEEHQRFLSFAPEDDGCAFRVQLHESLCDRRLNRDTSTGCARIRRS